MEKNTPKLWDSLWEKTSEQEDMYNLIKEEKGIRWQRIEKIILEKFKTFKNLNVIEVGSGAGTNALLFAKRGAKITILDYSQKAIQRSKEFFKRNKCNAKFILADALNLPKRINSKYDIAMSFGLAEHFTGKDRFQIIRAHLDLINESGMILISVPNKYNFPYRAHKFITEKTGLWKFGEEYPFSRREFKKIIPQLGNFKSIFIGDSFFSSFNFINFFKLFRKRKKQIKNIKKQGGTFLDSFFSYSLVLVANYKLPTKN